MAFWIFSVFAAAPGVCQVDVLNSQVALSLWRLILMVKYMPIKPFFFSPMERKRKRSDSATGDRTRGLWLCIPALWLLSYHTAGETALNNSLLNVYQCQRYTVGCLNFFHFSVPMSMLFSMGEKTNGLINVSFTVGISLHVSLICWKSVHHRTTHGVDRCWL